MYDVINDNDNHITVVFEKNSLVYLHVVVLQKEVAVIAGIFVVLQRDQTLVPASLAQFVEAVQKIEVGLPPDKLRSVRVHLFDHVGQSVLSQCAMNVRELDHLQVFGLSGREEDRVHSNLKLIDLVGHNFEVFLRFSVNHRYVLKINGHQILEGRIFVFHLAAQIEKINAIFYGALIVQLVALHEFGSFRLTMPENADRHLYAHRGRVQMVAKLNDRILAGQKIVELFGFVGVIRIVVLGVLVVTSDHVAIGDQVLLIFHLKRHLDQQRGLSDLSVVLVVAE